MAELNAAARSDGAGSPGASGLAEPKRRRKGAPGQQAHWYTHVMLIIIVVVIGFPLAYAMLVGTQTNQEYFSHQLSPGSALKDNFDTVWNQRDLGLYMRTSAIQSVVIAAGKAVTAVLAGLAFVYFRFNLKGPVFWFVLVTLMMPTEISILALFEIVSGFGWTNSMLAITVPFLASATGAFLFRQHFSSMPAELSDAARVDGAGPLRFLWSVLLPLSWNVFGALAVIQFLYSWNMYLWPSLIIREDDSQTVQIGLGALQNIGGGLSYGPLMLGAVIASIPPTLVFVLLQKTFLKGFAITAEK
jgi:sn-glycerol 3-phosphate transport system permease protein